jgi:hypothetical protein
MNIAPSRMVRSSSTVGLYCFQLFAISLVFGCVLRRFGSPLAFSQCVKEEAMKTKTNVKAGMHIAN